MKGYRFGWVVGVFLEVLVLMLLVRIGVEGFRRFTWLGQWEVRNHLNLSLGWTMVAVSYGCGLLRGDRMKDYGLDVRLWPGEVFRFASIVSGRTGRIILSAVVIILSDKYFYHRFPRWHGWGIGLGRV